jgi:hypothetical protein
MYTGREKSGGHWKELPLDRNYIESKFNLGRKKIRSIENS